MFYKLRKPPPEELIPTELGEGDMKQLHEIYLLKRGFVLRCLGGALLFWALVYYRTFPLFYDIFERGVWKQLRYYPKYISLFMIVGGILLLILILGASMYHKQVYLVRQDIRARSGVYVAKEIIRKSIPYHQRYFFFCDDLKMPHIEVDAETYYLYSEGDTFWVLRALNSRIVLGTFWSSPKC